MPTTSFNYHKMDSSDTPYLRIALLGDPNVGKTCLASMHTNSIYSKDYIPTIAVDLVKSI